MARYVLERPARLSLEAFATRSGLHPEMVRRFVVLGLLEPARDAGGRLWFAPAQLRTAGRIQRLHAGLSVNYAALGVVMDLLDRIEVLEAAMRRSGTGLPRDAVRSPSTTARLEE